MLDLFGQLILLNAVEGFMCIFICINLNRNVAVSKFISAWVLCTLTIYLYPIMIPVPIIGQVISCIVNAYIVSRIFEMDYKFCIKRIAILYFVITLLCEVATYIISVQLLKFNPYTSSVDTIHKFLMGIPIRISELLLIYFYKKVVESYE